MSQYVRSSNWRIVFPRIAQKPLSQDQCRSLRELILENLRNRPQQATSSLKSQFQRGLRYYHIAIQHHADGAPHLDILLVYQKSLLRKVTDFNFLLRPHKGHATKYRKLNQAILAYGRKQDKDALSNLPEDTSRLLQIQHLKSDPFRVLQLQMRKDPLNFNLEQYAQTNDLFQHISGWSSLKTKLKDSQTAAANLSLRQRSGFRPITRSLIQQTLTPKQLKLYDSWPGYQRIVDHLNVMVSLKGNRDPKTKNLLLTGPPDCGKSALVWHPNPHGIFNPISRYCSVYPIGMSQWFPKYQSGVYDCIYWNQAKLTSYSYDTILKLLDGSPLDLPNKGSVSRKVDNPLIIMTSNMTLDQMIQVKFSYNRRFLQLARKTMASRVQNVVVPDGLNLFLLQKLLLPS